MVVAICARCHKRVPDSFHDWEEECECIDWRKQAKKMKWMVRIKGKLYDYTKKVK